MQMNFSSSYFRQQNFGTWLCSSSEQSVDLLLLNKSCFRIHVGRTFLCSTVAVTAKHCCPGWYQQPWPLSPFRDGHWAFLIGCSWFCRSCIRQSICHPCYQLWEGLGGCSSCGKQQVLMESTTTEKFMYKHHNKNLKVAVLATLAFQ